MKESSGFAINRDRIEFMDFSVEVDIWIIMDDSKSNIGGKKFCLEASTVSCN